MAGKFDGFGKVVVLDKSTDPWAYVVSANIHRRHLTIEDKDRLIVQLLKADPTKSNRQVAKIVDASHPHVAKVRGQAERTGDVETVTTSTDTKGRQQPAKKKRRTEDDFRRDLQAKKAAAIATATPGDIGPMLPATPPPVIENALADAVAANPLIAAWDTAIDAERQQFVAARAATAGTILDRIAALIEESKRFASGSQVLNAALNVRRIDEINLAHRDVRRLSEFLALLAKSLQRVRRNANKTRDASTAAKIAEQPSPPVSLVAADDLGIPDFLKR
jgi:DNA-binding Lrp family transcriptional regulator